MSQLVPLPKDPTPTTPGIPAGWYFDPTSSRQRWWDGIAWTENFAMATTTRPGNPHGGAALTLGLIGFFLTPIPFFIGLFVGGIPALLGVVFGVLGMVSANRQSSAAGTSVAGFILGLIALIGILFGSGTIW